MNKETKEFIHEHAKADVRTLALQAKRYPNIDMPKAITQIAGWQIATHKIPTWAIRFISLWSSARPKLRHAIKRKS